MACPRRSIPVVLRVVVSLQFAGYAWSMLSPGFGETAIVSLLWDQRDLGGFGWSESVSVWTEMIVGWCFCGAAVLTVVRPCRYVLVPMAAIHLGIAAATWQMDIGFMASWAIPEHALRIAAPIVLLYVDPWRRPGHRPTDESAPRPFSPAAETIARIACCLTFFGHGIKAWYMSSDFENLLALACQRWLEWRPEQFFLDTLTRSIGVVDMLCALLIVVFRWPVVAWWMAFWGLVTAASRTVSMGLEFGLIDTIVRAAHAGVPAVLGIYWIQSRKHHQPVESESTDESNEAD